VLNEFQCMHHTYAIALMTSSSVGICECGDGNAPGGRGRQRAWACTSSVGGIENASNRNAFGGVGKLTGTFGGNMSEEW
jgi:hypothetical protein